MNKLEEAKDEIINKLEVEAIVPFLKNDDLIIVESISKKCYEIFLSAQQTTLTLDSKIEQLTKERDELESLFYGNLNSQQEIVKIVREDYQELKKQLQVEKQKNEELRKGVKELQEIYTSKDGNITGGMWKDFNELLNQ